MIPYGRQDINEEDIEAVVAVLRSDFLTQGPMVPLIKYVASTGKPLIISTGMADAEEIHEAIQAAREGGGKVINDK